MANYFGRINEDGNVAVLDSETGCPVTRFYEDDDFPVVYPVGSSLSAHYEHAEGIILTTADASNIGLTDDDENQF